MTLLTNWVEIPDFNGDPQVVPTTGALGPSASGVTPVIYTIIGVGFSPVFFPLGGRKANVTLWGTFSTTTIQLVRSFNNGTNWHPLTLSTFGTPTPIYTWTSPASESFREDEANVWYALQCTYFSDGPVNCRLSQ